MVDPQGLLDCITYTYWLGRGPFHCSAICGFLMVADDLLHKQCRQCVVNGMKIG